MVDCAQEERNWILRAIEDPSTCVANSKAAKVDYVLRRDVLEQLDEALGEQGLSALVVKGAGLAETVYEKPWHRPMSDIDLLVGPAEKPAVLRALRSCGLTDKGRAGRGTKSHAMLGEDALIAARGPNKMVVEVHHHLDKVAPRPVPLADLQSRSQPLRDLVAIRSPESLDHALLVVLHASSSEFLHPLAWIDLSLLLRAPCDWSTLVERARSWRLATALYASLRILESLSPGGTPEEVLRALRPREKQRRALERMYQLDEYPPTQGPMHLGLSWLRRQLPLRDDKVSWSRAVARFALARSQDYMSSS